MTARIRGLTGLPWMRASRRLGGRGLGVGARAPKDDFDEGTPRRSGHLGDLGLGEAGRRQAVDHPATTCNTQGQGGIGPLGPATPQQSPTTIIPGQGGIGPAGPAIAEQPPATITPGQGGITVRWGQQSPSNGGNPVRDRVLEDLTTSASRRTH